MSTLSPPVSNVRPRHVLAMARAAARHLEITGAADVTAMISLYRQGLWVRFLGRPRPSRIACLAFASGSSFECNQNWPKPAIAKYLTSA
jgi:hypothetical protein